MATVATIIEVIKIAAKKPTNRYSIILFTFKLILRYSIFVKIELAQRYFNRIPYKYTYGYSYFKTY